LSGDEGPEATEVLEAGTEGFTLAQLERHVGFVAGLDLISGKKLCGVIVAVSATSLMIEGWDSTIHATNGNLETVAIDSVRRIVIP
jgi:hypothetical protein